MSRIAVIAHARAKAVALFYVALLRREIKQVTYCEPVNKPGDCVSYKCPVVQDRLASGANVWSLFVIRRDWGLPSRVGSQRMRFEDGRSIRNTKLPKKPARKCGTQTMFSELPGSSEPTRRIPNQTNHSPAVRATYERARAQGSLPG